MMLIICSLKIKDSCDSCVRLNNSDSSPWGVASHLTKLMIAE